MTNGSVKKSSNSTTTEHCIDLPGERVQCWMVSGTGKLKVILRKHRDVIFDVHTVEGASYSLEASESDFYNVRDKKLVVASQQGKVKFRDGERIHVWISRGFRGALTVKCGERVISHIRPNELDAHQYSNAPEEKPAPIIVAIKNSTSSANRPHKIPEDFTYPSSLAQGPKIASALPVVIPDIGYPVVCVVDGTVKGMPAELTEYFKNGGDASGLTEIDPYRVATRNWIWGQLAGTGAYVKDNWDWLRASLDEKTSKGFQLVKAQIRKRNGQIRFYFSGYSRSNKIFGPGGFGPGNDRIITIFSGVGKTESAFAATLKGVAGSFKGNALVSFIFGSATAIVEWKADIQKDGYDLAAALLMTVVKAIVVAAAVTLIVGAIVLVVMFFGEAALSVISVGCLTIAAGFVFNYIVEVADKSAGRAISKNPSSNDGLAGELAAMMRDAGRLIEKNWKYLMDKMSGDYKEIRFDQAI